jgi:hypothetical protein
VDAVTVSALSRIASGETSKAPRNAKAMDWLRDLSLVVDTARGPVLSPNARDVTQRLLRQLGAEPHQVTTITDQDDRSASRRASAYEKVGGHVMARNRILIRAAPGRPMMTASGPVRLPPGASMDIDLDEALASLRHRCIMLVENRLCFDALERLSFTPAIYEDDPLVLFKGSPFVSSGHGRYMKTAALPVHVFGDQDPAGVAMAIGTCNAVSLVEPPIDMIMREIAKAPNHDLYEKQMATAEGALGNAPSWAQEAVSRITASRSAVPQESFMR